MDFAAKCSKSREKNGLFKKFVDVLDILIYEENKKIPTPSSRLFRGERRSTSVSHAIDTTVSR